MTMAALTQVLKSATGLIRVFAPYEVGTYGPGVWETSFKDLYMRRCIQKWQSYCEDFTGDDIIQAKPYTPRDIAEKLVNMVRGDWMVGKIADTNLMSKRPDETLSQYRTPIKGLYLCGSGSHPGGGITCGPGALAASVIAQT